MLNFCFYGPIESVRDFFPLTIPDFVCLMIDLRAFFSNSFTYFLSVCAMVNTQLTNTCLYSIILAFFSPPQLFHYFLVIFATFGVHVHPEFRSICLKVVKCIGVSVLVLISHLGPWEPMKSAACQAWWKVAMPTLVWILWKSRLL